VKLATSAINARRKALTRSKQQGGPLTVTEDAAAEGRDGEGRERKGAQHKVQAQGGVSKALVEKIMERMAKKAKKLKKEVVTKFVWDLLLSVQGLLTLHVPVAAFVSAPQSKRAAEQQPSSPYPVVTSSPHVVDFGPVHVRSSRAVACTFRNTGRRRVAWALRVVRGIVTDTRTKRVTVLSLSGPEGMDVGEDSDHVHQQVSKLVQ
jgi:hypothetical protein